MELANFRASFHFSGSEKKNCVVKLFLVYTQVLQWTVLYSSIAYLHLPLLQTETREANNYRILGDGKPKPSTNAELSNVS
jgi:hypothetical protein